MFDIFKKLEGLRPAAPTGPVEAIVAGLGNPGREYENTRHNAGHRRGSIVALHRRHKGFIFSYPI